MPPPAWPRRYDGSGHRRAEGPRGSRGGGASIQDIDSRDSFLEIERFARLPENQQRKGLAEFYAQLSPIVVSGFVEMVLSSAPHDILNPNAEGDAYDGNTFLWAEQLDAAAAEMTAEQVADRLEHVTWLRVAARARVLDVFRQYPEQTRELVDAALNSPDKGTLSRACALIQGLELKGFTDRLIKRWLAGDGVSQIAWGTLLFSGDPALGGKLMARIEKDPEFLARCAGLLQGSFAGEPANPLLLEFLDGASPSHDRELAYHAASAMRCCVDARLVDTVARFAGDEEIRFREVAAEMIPRVPDEAFQRIRTSLLPLLEDPDENVRGLALKGFSRKQDPAAGPVILEALKSESTNEGFKIAVMQSMSSLTGRSWNYHMHEWGLGTKSNREAVAGFEAWLNSQK